MLQVRPPSLLRAKRVISPFSPSMAWPCCLFLKYPWMKPTTISSPQIQIPLFAGQPPKRPGFLINHHVLHGIGR